MKKFLILGFIALSLSSCSNIFTINDRVYIKIWDGFTTNHVELGTVVAVKDLNTIIVKTCDNKLHEVDNAEAFGASPETVCP